jgi:nucleotide-binding universal stress UspA family protein
MYTKILVPLDGSATAEAALPYVEALAVGFKTAVELLSVIDVGAMTAYLSADKVPQLDGIVAKEEENSRTYLASVTKNYSARSTVTCQVVRGDPAEAILEASSKDRDTLIAMATHGHSGAKRWLLGSVAEKVLRNSTCPLFLVRASEAETEARRIINSIVVPLDGSPLAEQILPTVSQWAQALDLEVSLIRAVEFPALTYYSSEEDFTAYEDFQENEKREAAAYLKTKAEALIAGGVRTVSISILGGGAAAAIISYTREAPRALIAMSTHGRSGMRRWMLGSIAEKVVRHGEDPVLIVRNVA